MKISLTVSLKENSLVVNNSGFEVTCLLKKDVNRCDIQRNDYYH